MREDLYLAEGGGDAPLAGLARDRVSCTASEPGPRSFATYADPTKRPRCCSACARERAVARGCQWLEVHRDADAPSFDDGRGWQDAARVHRRAVTP